MPRFEKTLSLIILLGSIRAFSETICSGQECATAAAANLGLHAIGSVLSKPKGAPDKANIEIDCRLFNQGGVDAEPCDSIRVEITSADKIFSKTVVLQGRILSTPVPNTVSSYTIVASRLKCAGVQRHIFLVSNKSGIIEFSRSDCN